MRTTRHIATAVAVLALIAVSAAGATSPAPSRSLLPARHGLFWGAEIGTQFTGNSPPWDMRALYDFQRVVRRAPSLVAFNIPFYNCPQTRCAPYPFPVRQLQQIRDYGALPVLNWGSTSSPLTVRQPRLTLRRIFDGRDDGYLARFAAAAAQWGSPLFLRFDWEMNGNWFPWSDHTNSNRPGDFIRAWRHVHDIFVAAGARNVTWVWCPYISRSPGARALAQYWPGSAYVDWTCLDGYNFGTRLNGPTGWRTFDDIFAPSYQELERLAPHKPVLLGEVASAQFGGDKAAWIHHMFSSLLTRYTGVGGVIWWDVRDSRQQIRRLHMLVENSRPSADAFAQSVSRAPFVSNTLSAFTTGPIPAPPLPLATAPAGQG